MKQFILLILGTILVLISRANILFNYKEFKIVGIVFITIAILKYIYVLSLKLNINIKLKNAWKNLNK